MLTKSYKAKSSVRRAAKGMEGFHMDTLEIPQDENGEWYGTDGWGSEDQQEVVLESNEDLETKMEVALEEEEVPSLQVQMDRDRMVLGTEEEPETIEDYMPAETVVVAKHRSSSVTNPCQMVWNICEEMKGTRRGIVLQACVDKGVAFNTARTQYQQWLVASRGETK